MAIETYTKYIIQLLLWLSLFCVFQCQIIHRSVSQSDYHVKYESVNSTLKTWISSFLREKSEKFVSDLLDHNDTIIWIVSTISAFVVGFCGVVPVLILPRLVDDHRKLVESSTFKYLVSFAAGTLLADVFLHLLPETFTETVLCDRIQKIYYSSWLLLGFVVFFFYRESIS